jgi:hypothetical protein
MNEEAAQTLDRLIQSNGLGWIIDSYKPAETPIPALLKQLDRVAAEYRTRTGTTASFSPQALEVEAERNPQRIAAFLQALVTSRTPAMLVMVWRILQGLTIRQIALKYEECKEFRMSVTLASLADGSGRLEEYLSDDPNDAVLLRHFGVATLDGAPVLDGFFPLRLRGPAA